MDKMTSRERERRLQEMIKKGKSAETLSSFLAEFQKTEEHAALYALLHTSKDPNAIRVDLRAAERFIDNMIAIINTGKIAESKLEDN